MAWNLEMAMERIGDRMGVSTATETVHCLIAFLGLAVALVFVFIGLN